MNCGGPQSKEEYNKRVMRFPGGLQEADSKKGGAQLWESSRNGSDISQSVVGSRLKVEHFHEVGEGAAGKSAPHNRRSI